MSSGAPANSLNSQWGVWRNVSRMSSWKFIAAKPVDDAGNVLQPPVILKDQQPVRRVAFDALTRYASGHV
jgi:hypothetical protein